MRRLPCSRGGTQPSRETLYCYPMAAAPYYGNGFARSYTDHCPQAVLGESRYGIVASWRTHANIEIADRGALLGSKPNAAQARRGGRHFSCSTRRPSRLLASQL